jgi:hypothetical protein
MYGHKVSHKVGRMLGPGGGFRSMIRGDECGRDRLRILTVH